MCLLFLLIKYRKGDDIMARKGQKFKERTAQEKYEIIRPLLNYEATYGKISKKYNIGPGLLSAWVNKYKENGLDGLVNKKKPGNPLVKYFRRKTLTKEEQLEYENMKLRIENELLKKGYLMKGDGTIVRFMK